MSSISAELSGFMLHANIDVLIARKAMDAAQREGDAAVKLIEDAARLQRELAEGSDALEAGTLDVMA